MYIELVEFLFSFVWDSLSQSETKKKSNWFDFEMKEIIGKFKLKVTGVFVGSHVLQLRFYVNTYMYSTCIHVYMYIAIRVPLKSPQGIWIVSLILIYMNAQILVPLFRENLKKFHSSTCTIVPYITYIKYKTMSFHLVLFYAVLYTEVHVKLLCICEL